MFTLFSIDLEQAKEVHRSLKLAAGMFLNIRDNLLPKLPASTEKGTDFDSRVVEAYAQQSQAEAQEITLARALELGHKPTVVSSLAAETANIFTQASKSDDYDTICAMYLMQALPRVCTSFQ